MSSETQALVSAQLGKPSRGDGEVVSRCGLGLPVVIEVHPELEGDPFPTLYWLTCPLARIRVSRIEQRGGVREFTARLDSDPTFATAFAEAQTSYAAARAARLPSGSPVLDRLRGGVGGAEGGVKCLHAHYAHRRAGGENPVGAAIEGEVDVEFVGSLEQG